MIRPIFLDFDGVILPIPANGKWDPDPQPSPEAIKNLNIIAQIGKADIIVTSSWRANRTVKELARLMASWGFTGKVLDKTTSTFGDDNRGADIGSWLGQAEDVESFVVIDDEGTDLEQFASRRVMPKADVGLQFHDASFAIMVLNQPI